MYAVSHYIRFLNDDTIPLVEHETALRCKGETGMEALILPSLEIHNFRAFDSLKIQRLGRVNLIVGKNNVGKSSVLEAIRLYANRGIPSTIWEILGMRDKPLLTSINSNIETDDLFDSLKYLFYGYPDVQLDSGTIRIGPLKSLDDMLSITMDWTSTTPGTNLYPGDLLFPGEFPVFKVSLGTKSTISYALNTSRPPKTIKPEINCIFVSPDGLNRKIVSTLWDNVDLTSMEHEVRSSLSIITPGLEGISFIGNTATSERVPIVRIAGIKERMPIRNLGDGMQRMLGIALALVNAKDGVLLIDEIENGLHYSVQPDVWRLIFRVARNLNIQVFATTHSWDCIDAFQKAALEDDKSEGLLIRLEVKRSGLRVTLFDEEMLSVATRERIEVR